MKKFSIPVQIRWADIDQNRHVVHSAYYDYGAMARIRFLSDMGLTTGKMAELGIGPVIFREEAVFRREISLEDSIEIDVEVSQAMPDYSRWTIMHHLIKAGGQLTAIITLDGAWIDLEKRKLTAPGEFVKKVFDDMPKSTEFQWLQKVQAG